MTELFHRKLQNALLQPSCHVTFELEKHSRIKWGRGRVNWGGGRVKWGQRQGYVGWRQG